MNWENRHERRYPVRNGAARSAAGQLQAGRPRGHRARRRDHHPGRRSRGHSDPAPLLQGRHGRGGQLPLVHGRDQGRARARPQLLPQSGQRHGGQQQERAGRGLAEDGAGAAAGGHAGNSVHALQRGRPMGGAAAGRQAAIRSARPGAARSFASGHCRQPRCLHPVHALRAALPAPDKQVASVCPFCGVGCQLTYNVKDNKILYVEGRDGPANHSRLCVKGRYGFDYAHHPQRLTVPLIRRAGVPKTGDFTMDPDRVMDVFREATWEEALEFAGGKLKAIRDQYGRKALAGFGSAKGSNEEAYLFQKLVRTGFGSNNVDHCTRLCHASSVVALLEGIGSGAVSNPVMDVTKAEVVFLIGANPTVNHPVAATWIKNAAKAGTKLVVLDPRRSDLARHAHRFLQFKPDTDVALLNALMHVVVTEGLVDEAFIASRTIGYDELRRNVEGYSPEAMAPICGIDADTIRYVARLYATSRASMILWGMGISQHVHGTDNARCLIALALMTGQIGRPGTGLHPLRGQNNVQGASDAGLIPMM